MNLGMQNKMIIIQPKLIIRLKSFMATSDNELEIRHPRSDFKFVPPKYTLGYLIIVVSVTIATSFVILSGNYSTWQADGQKIIDERQWYRLVTTPFAVASFLDLSFLLVSFLWLLFTVTQFESRHSTIYTLYHFWKTNICIALGVSGMYWIMFELTRMKNFIMNVGGIYPYTLHIYLKTCLQKPGETVNHWFLPCPINKWVMGYLVGILSVLLAPESQGCMVVWLNYLFCSFLVFLRYITTIRCLYYEGPLCYFPISILQKILPGFIKNHYGYCSVDECTKRSRQLQEIQRREAELVEENGENLEEGK